MCFIAVSLNKNRERASDLFSVLKEKERINKDGFGFYALPTVEGEATHIRAAGIDSEKILPLMNSQVVMSHLRFSTGGDKGEKNYHTWKIGNWIFLHNGGITMLKEKEYCDSFIFFNALIEKKYLKPESIRVKKIDNYAKAVGLMGRFILFNEATKEMYFFGDFDLIMPNKNEDRMYVTSAPIELSETIFHYGLLIPSPDFSVKATLEGIWKFDLKKFSFSLISYITSFNDYSYPTAYTGYKSESKKSELCPMSSSTKLPKESFDPDPEESEYLAKLRENSKKEEENPNQTKLMGLAG